MTTNAKLTKKQQEVVELMQNGWQLANSMFLGGHWYIQQGGAGRGGEYKRMNANTAFGLKLKGVIEVDKRRFPTTTWKLRNA